VSNPIESKQAGSQRLLEVCVGSLDDALAAEKSGADRIELCGALELGGLTPSIALVEQVVRESYLPVMVMIRPRSAGFAYCENELNCMKADAEKVLAAGADGIVFGMLDSTGRLDASQIQQMVKIANNRETVFHRAFDSVLRQEEALEELIQHGVTRVLTSGGATTALEGAPVLKRLTSISSGRIEVLAGGGINAADVARLLQETGCMQLHIGASVGSFDDSISAEASGGLCDLRRLSSGAYRAVDSAIVADVRRAVDGHST
jgi:copper homeostasis protein